MDLSPGRSAGRALPDRPFAVLPAQRVAARTAAIACILPFALIVFANFGLRSRFLARDDMPETLHRIAAAETLFRFSVALDVVYVIGVIVTLSALYVVLRPAGRSLALLASFLKLAYAGTAALTALSFLAVLRLATGSGAIAALGPGPLAGLARLLWSSTADQYYVGLAFWSLSSTLFAVLWLRSRYVPAALAVFGLASSAWCVVCTFAYLVQPAFREVVNLWWWDSPMAVFDLVLSAWLLVRGLPGPTAAATGPAPVA